MKLVNSAIDNPFLLGSFLLPGIFIAQNSERLRGSDYLSAALVFLLQLLCAGVFHKTRPQWEPAVLECVRRSVWPDESNAVEIARDLFFLFMILLFGYLLPYALYLPPPMPSGKVTSAFTLSCIVLAGRLQLFTRKGQSRWRHLPFVSLAGLLWFLCAAPVPNPTRVTLLLLAIFCAETALSVGAQVYRSRVQ